MKLALVVTDNYSAWNFRTGLMRAAVESGIETYLLAPRGPYDRKFEDMGVRRIPISVERFFDPMRDLKFISILGKIFQKYPFDVVHNFSIKPNIFGAVTAHLARVPTIIGSVTGLGNLFIGESDTQSLFLRLIATHLYRLAFSVTDKVWFQNSDDIEFFVTRNMIEPNKAVLISSSGVDLNWFSKRCTDRLETEGLKRDLGIAEGDVVVSMITRTLWSKGVEEFVRASEALRDMLPTIKFVLVGDGENNNPDSVPHSYLRSKQSANLRWLGWRNDVRGLLAASDILVLLSRYREGTPRSLLEAMAMEKPIVATDVAGCRNLVEIGRNGYLVEPRNSPQLVSALLALIKDPSKRTSFGAFGRKKVTKEFDQTIVNRRILVQLYGVK